MNLSIFCVKPFIALLQKNPKKLQQVSFNRYPTNLGARLKKYYKAPFPNGGGFGETFYNSFCLEEAASWATRFPPSLNDLEYVCDCIHYS